MEVRHTSLFTLKSSHESIGGNSIVYRDSMVEVKYPFKMKHYDSAEISLYMNDELFRIVGSNLLIVQMMEGYMKISGEIAALHFEGVLPVEEGR